METESPDERKQRAAKVISRLKQTHPDARLALNFSNPLELLIAVILAAQTTEDEVNAATPRLFKKYATAAAWAAEPRDKLLRQLAGIDSFRTKARYIQSVCSAIVTRFGGQMPSQPAELLTLPGVNRKIANTLLGNAFGVPAIGVDTHVWRVSQRLGLSSHDDSDAIEADLAQLVPQKEWVRFCHLLQFHGRRVCTPKKPECGRCTVAKLCPHPQRAGVAG